MRKYFEIAAAVIFGSCLGGLPLYEPPESKPKSETRQERIDRQEREMEAHYARLATRHAERKAKRPTINYQLSTIN